MKTSCWFYSFIDMINKCIKILTLNAMMYNDINRKHAVRRLILMVNIL